MTLVAMLKELLPDRCPKCNGLASEEGFYVSRSYKCGYSLQLDHDAKPIQRWYCRSDPAQQQKEAKRRVACLSAMQGIEKMDVDEEFKKEMLYGLKRKLEETER